MSAPEPLPVTASAKTLTIRIELDGRRIRGRSGRSADATDDEPDPWPALAMLVEPLFGASDDLAAHWRIWSEYWARVARRPEIATAYADVSWHWEGCCARIITGGVAGGAFRPVDPQTAALKLAAYSDGIGAQRAQRAAGLTAEVARAWMREFTEALLTRFQGRRASLTEIDG